MISALLATDRGFGKYHIFSGISLADTHGRSFLRLFNPTVEAMLVAEGTLKPAATKVLTLVAL